MVSNKKKREEIWDTWRTLEIDLEWERIRGRSRKLDDVDDEEE